MSRKFKLGTKINVPLMKDASGYGPPIFSDKDPAYKAYLTTWASQLPNSLNIEGSFLPLEICGYYEGNYQGLNAPYLFRINKENLKYFKSNKFDPESGILGAKFSSLTGGMQSLTILSSSMGHDEYFYAIEKDVVEKYMNECRSEQKPLSSESPQKNHQPSNKETVNMSTAKTPGQIFKSDLEKSAYRVAARQTAKVAKSAILSVVKNKSSDKRKANKTASALQEVLDTDLGTYGISEALGWMLTYAPGIKEHPNAQRLAEELRVEGLAGAGDLALDKVLQSLVPSMVSVLNSLPAVEKGVEKEELSTVTKVSEPELEHEVVTLQASSVAK